MCPQLAAFASGVLPDIYAFHRSTGNSASLWAIQAPQSRAQCRGWAPALHARLERPPALPLRPVIPNNARTPRITAAAGTKFAGASSQGTFRRSEKRRYSPATVVYTPRRSVPHVASLRQGCPHCAIFPAAASRRSLGRISVPMWPCALSGRLPIVGLVVRCTANCLIGRESIPGRHIFRQGPMRSPAISGISRPLGRLFQARGQVIHAILTRPPLACGIAPAARSTCMHQTRLQRSF